MKFRQVLAAAAICVIGIGTSVPAAAGAATSTDLAPQVTVPDYSNHQWFDFPLTGITFAGPDAGGNTVAVDVTVSGGGTLDASTSGGVVVNTISGTEIQLVGLIASLNTFIADEKLVFEPSFDDVGDFDLTVTIDDQGNTGTGGPLTDTQTGTITLVENQPPVVTAPTRIFIDPYPAETVVPIDVDDDQPSYEGYGLRLNSTQEEMLFRTRTGPSTTPSESSSHWFWTSRDGDDHLLSTFTLLPADGFIGTTELVIGAGGHWAAPYDELTEHTIVVEVGHTNAPPLAEAPVTFAGTEHSSVALDQIAISDPDAHESPVAVDLSVDAGELAATSGLGVTVMGSGTSELNLFGTIDDINDFIAVGSVSFSATTPSFGEFTLTVDIDDLGNNGSGGSLTDSTTTTITLTEAPRTPGLVQNITSSADGSSLTVTWDPPIDPGTMPIVEYTAEAFQTESGPAALPSSQGSCTTSTTTCTITDLDPGGYLVLVTARNGVGSGPTAESQSPAVVGTTTTAAPTSTAPTSTAPTSTAPASTAPASSTEPPDTTAVTTAAPTTPSTIGASTTVPSTSTAPTVAPSLAPELPATGSDTTRLGTLAALFLASGAALITATRRRA